MKNIILFGSNGMLGNYIKNYLYIEKTNLNCINLTRKDINVDTYNILDKIEILFKSFNIQENDVIINCIGILKNYTKYTKSSYININILFPQQMAFYCKKNNLKFIHISTDCIFSGKNNNYYNENDIPDPVDIYGMSKYFGEPDDCMVIRTSIIGDNNNNRNLLSSLKNKTDKNILGYKNCLWNGISCYELTKFIIMLIINDNYWIGIRHVISNNYLSKYDLVNYLNELYDLNLIIKEDYNIKCDRRLTTTYDNCIIYKDIKLQLKEQYDFDIKFNNIITNIGQYECYENCRSCGNNNMIKYINFKYIPLAGGFIKDTINIKNEQYFPFDIRFCSNCSLSQSTYVIENNKIFHNNYFYHSSTIQFLVEHFNNLALKISKLINKENTVLEIGCNDGVLLNPLSKILNNCKIIGVDPCKNVIDKITNNKIIKYNNLFNKEIALKIKKENGYIDLITSSNCMAHIVPINEIIDSISLILNNTGILIIEVHYLPILIAQLQYDFMYHEHQYYYTLTALCKLLERHNLYIYDCVILNLHGGSIRIFASKNINKEKTNIFKEIINKEIIENYTNILIYKNFEKLVYSTKWNLINLLNKIKNNNKIICGYGASGRATIISNFCSLDNIYLDFIVDDSPIKYDNYTPGSNLLIKSSNNIYNCDYVLILAWPYFKDIIKNHLKYITEYKKTFIIPLPDLLLIDINNYKKFILE
jgi:dTDP-4-dehydrorhamnose reductase/SAM-dependent methyltransferase